MLLLSSPSLTSVFTKLYRVKIWTLELPLWRTTGRRRVLSTLWHGRHSQSTRPSSDADFSFLSDRAWSPSVVNSGSMCMRALVTLRVTLLGFFSNLKHVKWPALIGLPDGEHVNQIGLSSVDFKHPALNLKERIERFWGGWDLAGAADVCLAEESGRGVGEWRERRLPLPESGKPRSHTETLTSASETNGIPSAFQFPPADRR